MSGPNFGDQVNICNIQDIFKGLTGRDPFTGGELDEDDVASANLVLIQQLLQRAGASLARISPIARNWISNMAKRFANSRAWQAAKNGIDKAIRLADKMKFWNRGRVDVPINHIVNGNFVTRSGQYKIKDGVHTLKAIEGFLRRRPDIAKDTVINRAANGVRQYLMPSRAYAGNNIRNGKTIFPQNWKPETIIDAVNKTINGRDITNITFENIPGTYQGVKLIVRVVDGRITTAFPAWPQ